MWVVPPPDEPEEGMLRVLEFPRAFAVPIEEFAFHEVYSKVVDEAKKERIL